MSDQRQFCGYLGELFGPRKGTCREVGQVTGFGHKQLSNMRMYNRMPPGIPPGDQRFVKLAGVISEECGVDKGVVTDSIRVAHEATARFQTTFEANSDGGELAHWASDRDLGHVFDSLYPLLALAREGRLVSSLNELDFYRLSSPAYDALCVLVKSFGYTVGGPSGFIPGPAPLEIEARRLRDFAERVSRDRAIPSGEGQALADLIHRGLTGVPLVPP